MSLQQSQSLQEPQDNFLNDLAEQDKGQFKELIQAWQLTFQEKRQLLEIYTDLKMWQEPSVFELWEKESSFLGDREKRGKTQKKQIMMKIMTHWFNLKEKPKSYKNYKASISNKPSKKSGFKDSGDKIFGDCPVASEKTVCCNLKTIDVVQNCGLACSYCSIQTFYNEKEILFENNLEEKLSKIKLDPNRLYHFGTGQSSDSLLWGNKHGILEKLFHFARKNPNVFLEFKTKTSQVEDFLKLSPPPNVFCTWSLNPQTIISNEEHLAASLNDRLAAAKKMASEGVKIGFHFHPIVYFENFEEEYREISKKIMSEFNPEDILFISLGTLTFIKPVIKQIRKHKLNSKILQMPLEEVCGRLSYPQSIKEKIFSSVYQSFKDWHSKVFFYLCMEPKEYWHSTFNFCYENNEKFEEAMLKEISKKSLQPLSL